MAQCKGLGGVEGSSPMSRKLAGVKGSQESKGSHESKTPMSRKLRGVKGSHESRLLRVEGPYDSNADNVNIETTNLWLAVNARDFVVNINGLWLTVKDRRNGELLLQNVEILKKEESRKKRKSKIKEESRQKPKLQEDPKRALFPLPRLHLMQLFFFFKMEKWE